MLDNKKKTNLRTEEVGGADYFPNPCWRHTSGLVRCRLKPRPRCGLDRIPSSENIWQHFFFMHTENTDWLVGWFPPLRWASPRSDFTSRSLKNRWVSASSKISSSICSPIFSTVAGSCTDNQPEPTLDYHQRQPVHVQNTGKTHSHVDNKTTGERGKIKPLFSLINVSSKMETTAQCAWSMFVSHT